MLDSARSTMSAMDEVKELMKTMQDNNAQLMKDLMETIVDKMAQPPKSQGDAPGQIEDKKNITRPMPFKGEETMYHEWKTKMVAYLKVKIPEAAEMLKLASKQDQVIDETGIRKIAADKTWNVEAVHNFSTSLY